MSYHIVAFLAGFLIDLAVGDPYWMPHPIRVIGNLIAWLDRKLIGRSLPVEGQGGVKSEQRNIEKNPESERRRGVLLVVCVTGFAVIVSALILVGAYLIHPYAGVAVESIMTYQILATKALRVESMKVWRALKNNDREGARHAVSMIVGRDTERLDETGIAKAAIETVAENTSDGVIAPMLFLAVGGPVLGFFYKAVNTMDSMVGYRNERYQDFGRAAAKLDDVLNYLPSRISGWLIIISSIFLGKRFSAGNAYRIFKRDRYNHKSPNSAQTESAAAGALGIRLAGDAYYFGVLEKKQTIGDALRPVEVDDIRYVNRLLYASAFLCMCVCMGAMAGLSVLL